MGKAGCDITCRQQRHASSMAPHLPVNNHRWKKAPGLSGSCPVVGLRVIFASFSSARFTFLTMSI